MKKFMRKISKNENKKKKLFILVSVVAQSLPFSFMHLKIIFLILVQAFFLILF